MNRTTQDKPAKPALVELDDTIELDEAALDRAAGGNHPLLIKALVNNEMIEAIKDGASNTLMAR